MLKLDQHKISPFVINCNIPTYVVNNIKDIIFRSKDIILKIYFLYLLGRKSKVTRQFYLTTIINVSRVYE